MFYVLQNEAVAARRRCPILLTDSATGTTGQSGLAVSTIYPYVSINGGAFAGGAGTIGAVNFGQYYYEFDASEINTLGLAGIHITAPGCRDYDAIVQVAAFNMYSTAGAGLTAGDVWSYGGGRTTTGGIANTVTNPVDVTTASMTGIANTTWDTDVSAYTSPSAGYDLTQAASGGAGISAYDVWNFVLSDTSTAEADLTGIYSYVAQIDSKTNDIDAHTQAAYIANSVWSDDIGTGANTPYGAGTAGTILYDLSLGGGSGISAADVWSYSDRTITGGAVTSVTDPVSVSTASMSGIANTVWNTDVSAFTSPSAGYDLTQAASAGGGISAYDVWNFDATGMSSPQQGAVLTDTFANTTQTLGDITGIPNNVWVQDISGYVNPGEAGFNLYQLGIGATGYAAGGGITAGDVWEYDISAISTAGTAGSQLNLAASPSGSGLTAGDVWDFVITGFGQTGSAALYTTQTNFTVGNIETYVQNQTPQDIWSYAGIEGRTITGGIADTVTSVTNRSGFAITGGTVDTVTNAVNVSTASMAGIANTVWSTLTAPYTTHATFGHQILRSDNAATIGEVTLHQSGGSKRVDADVHAFVNNTASATAMLNILTGIGSSITGNITGNITGDLSGSVGSVTNPISVSTVSMSGIANTVWNTDISAISTAGTAGSQLNLAASPSGSGITAGEVADAVWNAATSSYTSNGTFGHNTLRSDNAGVAGTVSLWTGGAFSGVYADAYRIDESYVAATALKDVLTGIGASITGNITGDLSGSVGSVTNDVSLSTATQASIANSVWITDVSSYVSPSAGYDLSNATAGGGITAGDVWSYATREITGGIADTVTTVSGNVLGSVNSVVTDVTLSAGTQASIANSVWSFDISTGPASPSASYYIDNINTEAQSAATDASTAASNTNDIGGTVWGYDPTALTSPQAGAILTDIQTDTNTIITDIGNIPNNVWASDVSGYSTPGEAGFELTQAASGAGLTAGDVWSYGSRTITGGIADTVTTLTNRSGFAITGGTVDTVTNGVTVSTNNDKTGYSLSGTQTFNMTGNITGNVSGSVGSVSGAVGSVTGNVGGNVVGSIASVTNPVTFNSGQYASIASSVWNAGTRTLTSGGGSGISAYDVWNFVLSDANTAEVDLVQAAAGSGLTAGDVWSAPSRTITGGIADTVTTVTNGVTVTTNNDKTGYALSGAGVSAVQSGLSTLTSAQVGTEVDSSLSDVGLTSTVTGRIDATVSSRLASSSYTAPPTEAAIAGTVWSYNTRTLTSGSAITAGDVWTYPTRSLTSGAGITVNAATNIINGPYFVKSNVDGQDGTLDVIRGMVQDIQLTVTDAFQNPFDTTALGLAVNFYDQAGTLVTSYATTELYGPAGLVQFTLNTAVTANEGRYNLILSAAGAGNTIKFGPLQTLVRPF